MSIDFDTLDYLKAGNDRQKQAYSVLTNHKVMEKLNRFTPILVGTIPINIAIETSDLDIICYWTDKQTFYTAILDSFQHQTGFRIRDYALYGTDCVVATFRIDTVEIEIFGQPIPTRQQMAYRHMLIEHKLLTERGEIFRQQIIDLKRQGYKTEPAFGKLLGFQMDPYEELLTYESP
ncbi:DUF4269 domain-containing protein [Spirosoma radiotolerans]|uniref:Diadenosine tetraphosphate hydrolase n=1 Tax=Spirosoma radiotolerans TaxID=1379870 RepID=A0A0E3V743_9BACT|nr:DUF4269 domain-containing protein [Spirosoma radiotolerans]AKD55091.1 diadenosine tetraphosphate hydrolase [Spirosoma radiotolerans]